MNRIFLFAFIILSGVNAFAQTLGIKMNPEADLMQSFPTAHFGMSCGLFYNQNLYKFLGITAGLDYSQIRYSNTDIICVDQFSNNYPGSNQERLHVMEMPVDLTFVMNENTSAKCLVNFTIGYAFGEVFEQQDFYTEARNTYVFLPDKKTLVNNFRMGLEMRYNPKPVVNLAFGIQYKYEWPTSPVSDYPNDFNILGAYIKTGLNFKYKKRMFRNSKSATNK